MLRSAEPEPEPEPAALAQGFRCVGASWPLSQLAYVFRYWADSQEAGDSRASRKWQRAAEPEPEPQEAKRFRSIVAVQSWKNRSIAGMSLLNMYVKDWTFQN